MDTTYRDRLEKLIRPCVWALLPLSVFASAALFTGADLLVMLLGGFTLGLVTAQLLAHSPAAAPPAREARRPRHSP